MTDPSKQRLIDVLIDMWIKERAKVLLLQEDCLIDDEEDYWDDPNLQELLLKYEEIARRGVPDPMRNHPAAEEPR